MIKSANKRKEEMEKTNKNQRLNELGGKPDETE
jgi:hypothetical protein